MKIITPKQYDEDYWKARRGVPTASEAKNILTPKGNPSKAGMRTYIAELIGDLYDEGYPNVNDFQSAAMKNGLLTEPEARSYYEFAKGIDLHEVGFCMDESGRFGFSPDSLCGDEGVVEIKSPLHKTQVKWLIDGGVPDEHIPQVHFTLIASGREWVDFLSYARGLPPLCVRVTPNDYTKALREQMEVFWTEFQAAKQLIADMSPTPVEFTDDIEAREIAKVF